MEGNPPQPPFSKGGGNIGLECFFQFLSEQPLHISYECSFGIPVIHRPFCTGTK